MSPPSRVVAVCSHSSSSMLTPTRPGGWCRVAAAQPEAPVGSVAAAVAEDLRNTWEQLAAAAIDWTVGRWCAARHRALLRGSQLCVP